jgi:hypothetical protein
LFRQHIDHPWAVRAEREFVNGGGARGDAEGDFAERVEHSARMPLLNLSLPNCPDVYAGKIKTPWDYAEPLTRIAQSRNPPDAQTISRVFVEAYRDGNKLFRL